ncbi:MAG: hypothetical protein ABFC96_01020 [Thermoguttaceae bacterium]
MNELYPHAQEACDAFLISFGRDDCDGQIRPERIATDGFDDLLAVHCRHVDVDKREIDAVAIEDFKSLSAIRGLMDLPQLDTDQAENLNDNGARDDAIVGNQYVKRHERCSH